MLHPKGPSWIPFVMDCLHVSSVVVTQITPAMLGSCKQGDWNPRNLSSLIYSSFRIGLIILHDDLGNFCNFLVVFGNKLNCGGRWLDYLTWVIQLISSSNFISIAPTLPMLNMTHYISVQSFILRTCKNLNQSYNGLAPKEKERIILFSTESNDRMFPSLITTTGHRALSHEKKRNYGIDYSLLLWKYRSSSILL